MDGEPVAAFTTAEGQTLAARIDPGSGVVTVPFSVEEAYRNYVTEAWQSSGPGRRLSSRQLDAYYALRRFIPDRARAGARRVFARWQRGADFPAWPYDGSVERLLRFYAQCMLLAADAQELEFRWFWPKGHRAAVILTHDVESAEGLRLAVDIADIEERHGLRSSFNIVADWYPVDDGILRELCERGFELGVHGVHHDRSMFSSRASFEAQVPVAWAWGQELGAHGFRSPATHRINEWLSELPFEYDCTISLSDPYEPIPGGCASPWPFFLSEVIELPYTLPQDYTLFTVLAQRSIDLWLDQIHRLEGVNGLIQCVSHPDPGYLGDPLHRDLYEEALGALVQREGLWMALPREVARWWRERDAGSSEDLVRGVARLDGSEVSFRPAEANWR
jgi:peptidoglycan/xylan/chitin deacetylase (PgdA/CDA1 family)